MTTTRGRSRRVSVPATVSGDPGRRPGRRDGTPCRLVVDAGVLRVERRDGRPLLQVPLDRVGLRPLPGPRPRALELTVDRTALRVDLRLARRRRAEGPRALVARATGAAADARAELRAARLRWALRGALRGAPR